MDERPTETEQLVERRRRLEAFLLEERRCSAQLMQELIAAKHATPAGADTTAGSAAERARTNRLVDLLGETEQIANELQLLHGMLVLQLKTMIRRRSPEPPPPTRPTHPAGDIERLETLLAQERKRSTQLRAELATVRQAAAAAGRARVAPAELKGNLEQARRFMKAEASADRGRSSTQQTDSRARAAQRRQKAFKRPSMTYTLSLDKPLMVKMVAGFVAVNVLIFACGVALGFWVCMAGHGPQAGIGAPHGVATAPAAVRLAEQTVGRAPNAADPGRTTLAPKGSDPLPATGRARRTDVPDRDLASSLALVTTRGS